MRLQREVTSALPDIHERSYSVIQKKSRGIFLGPIILFIPPSAGKLEKLVIYLIASRGTLLSANWLPRFLVSQQQLH